MSAESRREWGSWAKFTASAVAGAASTLVVVALTWAEVRHSAEAADARSLLNRTRIELLEKRDAADAEWRRSTTDKLSDMKKLLEKLADKLSSN